MSGETFDYGFSQSADVDLPVIDTFDSPFSPLAALNMSDDIALWPSAFADGADVFAGDSDEQTQPPLSPLLSPPRILDDLLSTSGSSDALTVSEAPLSKKPRYVRVDSKRSSMTIPMSDFSAVTSPSSTPSPSIPSSPVPSLDSHSAYSSQSANGSDDEYNRVDGDVGLRDRRLARKAELARLSRKRKRTRLDDLTNQCKTLQTQLSQLKRAQHSAATTVTVEPIHFDVSNVTADSLEVLATSLEQRQALANDMMERVTELIKPVALIDSVIQAMSSAASTDASVRAIVPRADEETVSHIAALRTTLNKQRRFDADAQRLAARLTGMLNKLNKQRAANLERIRSAMETDQINAVIRHANQQ